MTDTARAAKRIRLIGAAALVWSAIGCAAYLSQVSMSPADLASLPPPQRVAWEAMPAWATAAYGVAVWFSLAGSIALIARRRLAVPLFAVSLIAALAQFASAFTATPLLHDVGPLALVLPLVVVAVGTALLVVAAGARRREVLR